MGILAEQNARTAMRTLTAVSRGADIGAFAEAGVRSLAEAIGADLTTLSVCSLDSGHRRVTGFPERALGAEDIACFDRHFFTHPLVCFHASHPEGGTHRISDAMSRSAFERTALYAEYYRRIGIRHAVAVPVFVDAHTLVSFVLNRVSHDFNARECAILESMRVPLAALYQQAQALEQARAAIAQMRAWMDADGWCEVEIDADSHIVRGSRRALSLLGVAVPAGGLRPGAKVPAEITTWLARSKAAAPGRAVRTLRIGDRQVALRVVTVEPRGRWCVFLRERPASIPAEASVPPLSPRETEVLDWVRAGKSDAQVAAILGISVRTVHKHLENTYVKLGVEGRTAAAMRSSAPV